MFEDSQSLKNRKTTSSNYIS